MATRSFKVTLDESDQIKAASASGIEVIRRGIKLVIEMEKALSEGRSLAVYLPGAHEVLEEYHPSNHLDDPRVNPNAKAEKNRSRCITKAWPIEGEIEESYIHLSGYPRYHKIHFSQMMRFVIRVYLAFDDHATKGRALVSLDANKVPREIRIQGHKHRLSRVGQSDVWQRQFIDDDGKRLLALYTGVEDRTNKDKGVTGCIFGENAQEDTQDASGLFLAQSVVVLWYDQSADVIAFVNSETFRSIYDHMRAARHELFNEGDPKLAEQARKAARRLERIDSGYYRKNKRNLRQELMDIHEYFTGHLDKALEDSKLEDAVKQPSVAGKKSKISATVLNAFAELLKRPSNSPIFDSDSDKRRGSYGHSLETFKQAYSVGNKSALRDLVRLWHYETLDCRVAWWTERQAVTTFKANGGRISSPLVADCFRILARVADNFTDKQRVFRYLHELDLDIRESKQRKTNDDNRYDWIPVNQCQDLIPLRDSLVKSNDEEKYERQPFLIGRDQWMRNVLINEKINNELKSRGLKFSYAAYEINEGVVRKCWSSGPDLEALYLSNLIEEEDVNDVENMVDNMIDYQLGAGSFEERMHWAGKTIGLPLMSDGCAIVCHTLRRVCSLVITGDNVLAHDAMERIVEYIDADIIWWDGLEDQPVNQTAGA